MNGDRSKITSIALAFSAVGFWRRQFKILAISFVVHCSVLFYFVRRKVIQVTKTPKGSYFVSEVRRQKKAKKTTIIMAPHGSTPMDATVEITLRSDLVKNSVRYKIILDTVAGTPTTNFTVPSPIVHSVFKTKKGEIGSTIILTEVSYALNKTDGIVLFAVSNFGRSKFGPTSYTYYRKRFYSCHDSTFKGG
jgi:hypothetical protein